MSIEIAPLRRPLRIASSERCDTTLAGQVFVRAGASVAPTTSTAERRAL